MPEHHNPAFGEAVKTLLRDRGLTLRSQRVRTGIDHTTMKSMCDGFPTRVEKVEQFARAFDEDVNRWRELAGYPPVLPASARERFWLRYGQAHAELAAEGVDLISPTHFDEAIEWDALTDEQIERMIQRLKERSRAASGKG